MVSLRCWHIHQHSLAYCARGENAVSCPPDRSGNPANEISVWLESPCQVVRASCSIQSMLKNGVWYWITRISWTKMVFSESPTRCDSKSQKHHSSRKQRTDSPAFLRFVVHKSVAHVCLQAPFDLWFTLTISQGCIDMATRTVYGLSPRTR